MCTCTERHDGSKAVYCVAAAPAGSQLVTFGGAEHALHIWDPRTPVSKETVRVHWRCLRLVMSPVDLSTSECAHAAGSHAMQTQS